MSGQGRGFYARCSSFPLPKHVLVFSVVCLLLPMFPLHYYIAILLYSVTCFVWKLVKSFTLGLICLVYVKID